MKLVVMGTGPFAVPSFRALMDSPHEIACLVTRPDKVARGRKKAPHNPMREAAIEHGYEVLAPVSINAPEGLALLADVQPDLLIVCDYGQILSNEALAKARLGGINLHGSLLPKYRGAAPINWALLDGCHQAGITVIHMTPRLDGGPMLVQRSLDVGANEDAIALEHRLSALGVAAVIDAIGILSTWDGASPLGTPQDPTEVTKAPRLKKTDGAVDWNLAAERIFNQVRALKPWPGTYTNLLREGKPPLRVILLKVRVSDRLAASADVGLGSHDDDTLAIPCGEGTLLVDELQPAGKRAMSSSEFARGYGSPLRFGEPH